VKSIALALVLSFLVSATARAEPRIESISFPTSSPPPVYVIPAAQKSSEVLFRWGLQALPESVQVLGALSLGGGNLGLTAEQSASLTPLVQAAYEQMATDEDFALLPSALPYCFSTTRPKAGHAFVYKPSPLPAEPRILVFLHGYGGNFQFYLWVLKNEFPDAVIVAPSWGFSWYDGTTQYLEDLLAAPKVPKGETWLMGLSAGGRGGFRIYRDMPGRFAGYVCLANVPETPIAQTLRVDSRILMVNGTRDTLVPLKVAQAQFAVAKRRVPDIRMVEVPGDHFFILGERKATFEAIRQFVSD